MKNLPTLSTMVITLAVIAAVVVLAIEKLVSGGEAIGILGTILGGGLVHYGVTAPTIPFQADTTTAVSSNSTPPPEVKP